MKVISFSALSAEKQAAIIGARQDGVRPFVAGNFCTKCKCCGRNQPIKGFAPDPVRKFRTVCAHCAQLRTPRLPTLGIKRDETLKT